ncbi:hypothetical protein V1520DRAFT_333067 [Lipomyces starkeyi]
MSLGSLQMISALPVSAVLANSCLLSSRSIEPFSSFSEIPECGSAVQAAIIRMDGPACNATEEQPAGSCPLIVIKN